MVITLIQANGFSDFEVPGLKKRAQESTLSPKTKHYKAMAHSKEVAFVSLDRWPELGEMAVYEIYVPPSARRQGIATAVLNETERISACEGFSTVSLFASPLDHGITEDALCDWYSRRGYVRDSNDRRKFIKIIGFKHWYAHDKFRKAIYILATCAEDVRTGLLHAWQDSLRGLNDDNLPDDLQKDFIWIKKQLHKFHEYRKGQLDDLKRMEKIDPTYKEKYAHHYPTEIEATLRRINKKTGAAIAHRIYNIYDVLNTRKWQSLTTHCTECRPQEAFTD
jgi:GNAT superfamily N-acetyltransferase